MAVSESLETPGTHVISYPHSVSGRGVHAMSYHVDFKQI